MTRKLIVSGILLVVSLGSSRAQFTPGILANDSYWSDGKAEFDIYDAQLMRNGQLRHCEVLHILMREKIDPKTFARVDDPKRADAISAIRMQQIWTTELGLFAEQGSAAAYWRLDSFSLARLNFVGTDSFGNVMKSVTQKEASFVVNSESYAAATVNSTLTAQPNGFFYDELPLRVRTIDWKKPPAEFEIQLTPPLAGVKEIEFRPARVSWKATEKKMEVQVQHADGNDRFLIDRDFPFLVREWQMADGSRLRMKSGLKADYWNYGRDGDRERALKNPMLGHPD